jgi:hypothetical protein
LANFFSDVLVIHIAYLDCGCVHSSVYMKHDCVMPSVADLDLNPAGSVSFFRIRSPGFYDPDPDPDL